MEIAKMSSKGQVTVPVAIRKRLGIKEGDKVLFIEEDGRIILANSTMVALLKAQEAFAGEADRIGLKDENDVIAMVTDIRRERSEAAHEGRV